MRNETWARVLWPLAEVGMVAVMIGGLAGWRCGGAAAIDALLARPCLDERLLIAAAANDDVRFNAALAQGAATSRRDSVGNTALSYAAMTGSAGRASRLLSAGADVNCANDWGFTPLMHAAQYDHVEVVAMFLRNGADPARRNTFGKTAAGVARTTESHRAAAMLAEWDERTGR